ncbi:ATP-dependent helicase [Candidatus Megaera venefica]|uniref:ATP-dependent helicase n=1 Tax=Candidatus Megaera venefica TaxID=2055910 RepID=A0ABU5ND75_9RICK|nr:ATP-dependent helicase [Candidatus Megaera venefica]MEA0971114.1 ATP-dependent helicase [Candidatus Megaera venefica]
MVTDRLNLEPEVQKIFEYVDDGQNFLLSGGAGSGKTFSLVQVIRQAIAENPTAKVACITYTNAAVREIEGRVDHRNLSVSTIHDFLWDNIKSYQKELKASLVKLINSEDEQIKSLDSEVSDDYFLEKDIRYKEYTQISEGIISHDDLLTLAHHMFNSYPKLCDILKDKFKFIFIDEYQDTSPLVIEVVLNFLKKSSRSNVIGFFGDAMQSIYDDSIGNLQSYVSTNAVQEVKKEQNRRNPRLVYELANKLRTDGIEQRHADDHGAPNMKDGAVKEGSIKFYHSKDTEKLECIKRRLRWDFGDTKKTKELNLTHNLIAHKAGFKELMDIYDGDKILDYKKRITDYIKENNITEDFSSFTFGQVIDKLKIPPTKNTQEFIDKNPFLYEQAKSYLFEEFRKIHLNTDALLDDKKENAEDSGKIGSKRDNLIKHLFKIQKQIRLYDQGEYNEFLRKTEFEIKSVASKRKIKEIISHLHQMSSNTIEEVIEYAHENGICIKDDKLADFIKKKQYVYDRVKQVKFKEFQNLFNYLEGYTAFSTQHKIKGTEFDNILVILNNGNWTKYNFRYLFEGKGTESVRERTRKLFYVCCTRAKENLVVYYDNPTETVIDQAKRWFGKDNVLLISDIPHTDDKIQV